MGIWIIRSFQSQFFRLFPHAVTKEEIQTVCNTAPLHLIHKISFVCRHICAVFHSGTYLCLNLLPVHSKAWVFQRRGAIPRRHTLLIEPHGCLLSVKFKPLSGSPRFLNPTPCATHPYPHRSAKGVGMRWSMPAFPSGAGRHSGHPAPPGNSRLSHISNPADIPHKHPAQSCPQFL